MRWCWCWCALFLFFFFWKNVDVQLSHYWTCFHQNGQRQDSFLLAVMWPGVFIPIHNCFLLFPFPSHTRLHETIASSVYIILFFVSNNGRLSLAPQIKWTAWMMTSQVIYKRRICCHELVSCLRIYFLWLTRCRRVQCEVICDPQYWGGCGDVINVNGCRPSVSK